MNLTEGQLFTIEALNRIEGVVWPDNATHARVDRYTDRFGDFLSFFRKDIKFDLVFICEFSLGASQLHNSARDSLITRKQFDSVDGWVRNDGNKIVTDQLIDIKMLSGKIHYGVSSDEVVFDASSNSDPFAVGSWRYHKPTKEIEMQNPKPYKKRDCIETLIDKRKDAIEQKRIALAALEEAEAKERELMLSIQAWAESYGFDIRVLDESNEKPELEHKPELVITDWRDLRVGDVIKCIKQNGGSVKSGDIGTITSIDETVLFADFNSQKGYAFADDHFNSHFKFIIRPSNK